MQILTPKTGNWLCSEKKTGKQPTLICSIGMNSTDVLQQTFIQKAPEPKRYVDETVCVHHNI